MEISYSILYGQEDPLFGIESSHRSCRMAFYTARTPASLLAIYLLAYFPPQYLSISPSYPFNSLGIFIILTDLET